MDSAGHTQAWDRYQRGIAHLNKFGLITDTEQAYRFYNGEQWYGVQAGNESLPVFNIIKPIVQHKVAVVGQNNLEIVYQPAGVVDEDYELLSYTCEALNKQASNIWERLKLTRRMWEDISNAAIGGDAYRYFYRDAAKESTETESVERTNIFFGDEQNPNIQEQPYIIIAQRRPVSVVREEAKACGASKEVIEAIVADNDTANQIGSQAKIEVKDNDHDKCITLVCFERIDGVMHVSRSTRDVMYDDREIPGMKLYPIVNFVWNRVKGSARGLGEVKPIVANQIEINKTLYRITQATKIYSLPRMVYNENLENPEDIEAVGVPLRVSGNNVQKIHEIVDYLRPQALSGDTRNLLDTYLSTTKELAGASDAAIGNINPEQASGTAILAAKRNTELPISATIESYKQYIEDIALVWFDLIRTYSVNGLNTAWDVVDEQGAPAMTMINTPPKELLMLDIDVRVEVSPTNPFDKFAQERSLENLLSAGLITFEEYVAALPDDAVMPKAKLTDIMEKREAQQVEQQQMMMAMPGAMSPGAAPTQNLPPMGLDNTSQVNA